MSSSQNVTNGESQVNDQRDKEMTLAIQHE